ncbi:MAG: phosphatase PAP2 family protein [Labilithrix sp.]|nr:phosphatase PAP2 family protein [Labilithrix sp.]
MTPRLRLRSALLMLAVLTGGGAGRAQPAKTEPPPAKEPPHADVEGVFPPVIDVPEPRRVHWPGRRFSTADWIITGAGAAMALAGAIIPPRSQHLRGGILFDEGARDFLRLDTAQARFVARDGSDVILSLEATWPFFVDALITTWWWRASPDTAAQMALVDAQALAVVTGLQGVTNTLVSRERPYGRNCGTEILPEQTIDCQGSVRYRSFFSGHAAFSFMSAGLICVHHLELDLLGGGAPDVITCVTAYTGAAITATLRTMGDMHYASDVIVGSLVGTTLGIAIPLWHYRGGEKKERDRHGVDVHLVPVNGGIGVGGTF